MFSDTLAFVISIISIVTAFKYSHDNKNLKSRIESIGALTNILILIGLTI